MPIEVTLAITLVSVVLTVVITRHYSSRRVLRITVVTWLDLVRFDRVPAVELAVVLNGETLSGLLAIRLVVENLGSVDLTEAMVIEPIVLDFGGSLRLVEVDMLDQPARLTARVVDDRRLQLDSLCLRRRGRAVMSVLAVPTSEDSPNPRDVCMSSGAMIDTKLSLTDLREPSAITGLTSIAGFLARHPRMFWVFNLFGVVFGIGAVLIGLHGFLTGRDALNPALDRVGVTQRALGLVLTGLGILLVSTGLSTQRELGYRRLFLSRSSEADSDQQVR